MSDQTPFLETELLLALLNEDEEQIQGLLTTIKAEMGATSIENLREKLRLMHDRLHPDCPPDNKYGIHSRYL